MEIKLFVLESTIMSRENFGDGDTGYSFTTFYKIIADTPKIIFAEKDWVKTLYLCQCEIEQKEYYHLNFIGGDEATVSFDIATKEFVQTESPIKFNYYLDLREFDETKLYINQYKTERIRNILESSNSPQSFILGRPHKNVLPKDRWAENEPFELEKHQQFHTIDLLKDSNVRNLKIPNVIDPVQFGYDRLNIYIFLPSENILGTNDKHYFLGSNIPNAVDFIPFEIKKDIYNYITCSNYNQIQRGDYTKGEKICYVVNKINETLLRLNKGYIKFFIGNEIVCKHIVPVNLLLEWNRIDSLYNDYVIHKIGYNMFE